jgi:hypothetical protein
MKPNILSLLACSGALIVIISAPSYALLPPGTNDTLPGNVSTIDKYSNSSEETPQQNAKTVEIKLQQLSQQKFGCSCVNCLAATKQMVKEGSLSI